MTKHHLRLREPGWRKGLAINGFGAFLSAVVALIIAVTKFADGAWAILVLLPLLVVFFLRLNKQYVREAVHLEADVPAAAAAPILRRHVVLVFVDSLDLAAARAIQYARTLTPDEMRAVHFVVDEQAADRLAAEWGRLGLQRVPLELVECPDRRLARAAVESVAAEVADGRTEVSVLMPDRKYRGLWHRILHDRTADSILAEVSRLPHANVTTVPFHFDSIDEPRVPVALTGRANGDAAGSPSSATAPRSGVSKSGSEIVTIAGCTAIATVRYRDRTRVAGRVIAMRVAPQHDAPVLELVLDDGTGTMSAVFLGRRSLGGVPIGQRLLIEGTVSLHQNRLAVLNPRYELLP